MGRSRTLGRVIFGRSHRIANLGHQRNAGGYPGGKITYGGGSSRLAAYGKNSNATGGIVEDDYEVDHTSDAKSHVESYMRGECANEGQAVLVEAAIDGMEILLITWEDFNPEHTAQPDEEALAYLAIPTNHPEAIGQIIEGAFDVFYEYAESVNR